MFRLTESFRRRKPSKSDEKELLQAGLRSPLQSTGTDLEAGRQAEHGGLPHFGNVAGPSHRPSVIGSPRKSQVGEGSSHHKGRAAEGKGASAPKVVNSVYGSKAVKVAKPKPHKPKPPQPAQHRPPGAAAGTTGAAATAAHARHDSQASAAAAAAVSQIFKAAASHPQPHPLSHSPPHLPAAAPASKGRLGRPLAAASHGEHEDPGASHEQQHHQQQATAAQWGDPEEQQQQQGEAQQQEEEQEAQQGPEAVLVQQWEQREGQQGPAAVPPAGGPGPAPQKQRMLAHLTSALGEFERAHAGTGADATPTSPQRSVAHALQQQQQQQPAPTALPRPLSPRISPTPSLPHPPQPGAKAPAAAAAGQASRLSLQEVPWPAAAAQPQPEPGTQGQGHEHAWGQEHGAGTAGSAVGGRPGTSRVGRAGGLLGAFRSPRISPEPSPRPGPEAAGGAGGQQVEMSSREGEQQQVQLNGSMLPQQPNGGAAALLGRTKSMRVPKERPPLPPEPEAGPLVLEAAMATDTADQPADQPASSTDGSEEGLIAAYHAGEGPRSLLRLRSSPASGKQDAQAAAEEEELFMGGKGVGSQAKPAQPAAPEDEGAGEAGGKLGPQEGEAANKKRKRRRLLFLLCCLLLLLLLGGGIGAVIAVLMKRKAAAPASIFQQPATWSRLQSTAAKSMAVGSSGSLWRVSNTAAPCAGMCEGVDSLSSCGGEVWFMDSSGAWQPATGMAGSKVIAGAQNGTAYVINDCSEGFYYNGAAWILIAGPFDPGRAILASASEGAEGAGPQ